jgi:hypothetical protein
MVTLRKSDFFHLEIAGKLRSYHGCYLDIILSVLTKKIIDEIPLDMTT